MNVVEIFIDSWNDRYEPFLCTKTADEILAKGEPVKRLPIHELGRSPR